MNRASRRLSSTTSNGWACPIRRPLRGVSVALLGAVSACAPVATNVASDPTASCRIAAVDPSVQKHPLLADSVEVTPATSVDACEVHRRVVPFAAWFGSCFAADSAVAVAAEFRVSVGGEATSRFQGASPDELTCLEGFAARIRWPRGHTDYVVAVRLRRDEAATSSAPPQSPVAVAGPPAG